MLVAYACRIDTGPERVLQIDALTAAGCERALMEKASGAQRDRLELKVAHDLSKTVRRLVDRADFGHCEIGLRAIVQQIDTSAALVGGISINERS